MTYRRLSDKEILKGFRQGNGDIIRDYFYGYCEVGYYIFDQRYQLHQKDKYNHIIKEPLFYDTQIPDIDKILGFQSHPREYI